MRRLFPLHLFTAQFFLIFSCALFNLRNLTWWDGEWYTHIVRHGYSSFLSADPTVPNLGNVGFFPGYPLAGWIAKRALGLGSDALPPEYGLLAISFLSVIFIWVYLAKWLALFGDEKPTHKILLFALYPFCIFFYYAYSEALYCASTLAFFYYSERGLRERELKFFVFALIAGIIMNATRFFGFVFALYPLVRAYQLNQSKTKALVLGVGSYLGMAAFFLYCEIKFGAWNFYFISKEVIWGNRVDWKKLLPPLELFNFSRPLRGDTTGKYVGILLGTYLTYRLIKLLKARDFTNIELALVLVSGMYWGEAILAMSTWDFSCLGRYLLPLLILILPFLKIRVEWNRKWIAFGLVLIGLQIAYALKFARYGWVA